jgi:hypothetical protein
MIEHPPVFFAADPSDLEALGSGIRGIGAVWAAQN